MKLSQVTDFLHFAKRNFCEIRISDFTIGNKFFVDLGQVKFLSSIFRMPPPPPPPQKKRAPRFLKLHEYHPFHYFFGFPLENPVFKLYCTAAIHCLFLDRTCSPRRNAIKFTQRW